MIKMLARMIQVFTRVYTHMTNKVYVQISALIL